MNKNKKKILKIILPCALLLLLFVVIVVGILKERELPVVGLGLHSVEVDKGAKLACEVHNRSDRVIHFDDYNIAKGVVTRTIGELGIEEIELITEDEEIQLKSGKVYTTDFVLEDLETGHYSAEVTAECKEGTKITVSIQFDVP